MKMNIPTLAVLLTIFVACGPAQPENPAARQGQPIGITIKGKGIEPEMNVVLQFTPDLAAEPDINWLAQNLVEARKTCLKNRGGSGEGEFHIELTLIDGIAQTLPGALNTRNQHALCFGDALSGKVLLRSDRGKRKAGIDVLLPENSVEYPVRQN